jgi:hypothetical protein
VSRGAVANPDRRRELRPVAIPPDVRRLLEPGSRVFTLGSCRAIVSQGATGWHLSISRPDRLPTWEEVRDGRYALVPDEATMALILPPRDEYVNVHEFCFHLREIPGE